MSDTKKNHYRTTLGFMESVAETQNGYFDPEGSIPFRVQNILRRVVLDNFPVGSQKVLDAGCGRGDFIRMLFNRIPDTFLVGSDFSFKMVKISCKTNPQGKTFFTQCSLFSLPFKENTFDVCVCLNVLHHIHKCDLRSTLKELAWVTRSTLILEIKSKSSLLWPLMKRMVARKFFPPLTIYGSTPRETEDILQTCGFYLNKVKTLSGLSGIFPNTLLFFEKR